MSKLPQIRKNLIARISSKVTGGNFQNLDQDLKVLQALDIVSEQPEKSIDKKAVAFLAIAIVLLFIGNFWKLQTEIEMSTQSKSLNFKAGPWTNDQEIDCEMIRINQFDNVTMIDAEKGIKGEGTRFIEFEGTVKLTEIAWHDTVNINLDRSNGLLNDFEVLGGSLLLEIRLDSGTYTLSQDNQITSEDKKGTYLVSLSSAKRNPPVIHLQNADTVIFENIPLTALHYLHRDVTDGGRINSSMQSGKIVFNETKLMDGFFPRDKVEIETTKIRSLRISLFGNQIKTNLHGVASAVQINKHDERLSLLQFIYFNQQYAFFWATGSFIIGLIWSVNRLFQKK